MLETKNKKQNIKVMSVLKTINEIDNENLLNIMFSKDIIVFEDVQGSKIWVNWNGEEFKIRPKSVSNDDINLVDLAMQNYYNPAIEFFNRLDNRIKSLLNKKWWFCFEYFPDIQPANIEYDRLPKNGLVLTTIFKNGKYDINIEEINEYSRLLNVDMIPIVFQGKLTEKMIEAIKYFLNTSESDLEYVFGDKSFSFFFYKILNPLSQNSFLMDDFQKNMEKLIVRIEDNDISFQLLNPLYRRMSEDNTTDYVEIYTLIIVNFLNFCQSLSLNDIKLKGTKKDEVYIYLISKLYNIYIGDVKEDIINFDFMIPEFFNKDKFKINKELILNKMTKIYIEENEKLEYIFKIILGSFNKKRKKPIGIFTENTVKLFNLFIDDISKFIDSHLNRIQELELVRNGLLDFDEFFDISYSTDSDGQVYPDIFDEIQKGSDDKKKKKDGGKVPTSIIDEKGVK